MISYWLPCLLQQAEAAAGAQQNEAFEIDQWILDFANLFREQLNIEPDKHLDLTNMGWDKLQASLSFTVTQQRAQDPKLFYDKLLLSIEACASKSCNV